MVLWLNDQLRFDDSHRNFPNQAGASKNPLGGRPSDFLVRACYIAGRQFWVELMGDDFKVTFFILFLMDSFGIRLSMFITEMQVPFLISRKCQLEAKKIQPSGRGHVDFSQLTWHCQVGKAYLTFVASGQISCKEDGGHHRPCAAANAAKAVTEALWDISKAGAPGCCFLIFLGKPNLWSLRCIGVLTVGSLSGKADVIRRCRAFHCATDISLVAILLGWVHVCSAHDTHSRHCTSRRYSTWHEAVPGDFQVVYLWLS